MKRAMKMAYGLDHDRWGRRRRRSGLGGPSGLTEAEGSR